MKAIPVLLPTDVSTFARSKITCRKLGLSIAKITYLIAYEMTHVTLDTYFLPVRAYVLLFIKEEAS